MFALKSAQSYLDEYPKSDYDDKVRIIKDGCVTKLAQLHLTIAEYYVTIGNRVGAKHHFKLASGQGSQGEISTVGIILPKNPVALVAAQRLAEYAE